MNEPTTSATPVTRNKLLAALPAEERALIEENSVAVPMKRREVLYRADEPIRYVYFIVDGIASLMSVMSDGGVETATVGREGMLGMPAFHGVYSTPEQAMVQVAGSAYRMDVETFRSLLPQLPKLECLLHRFSVVLFTLAAQNSGCNRKHSIEARCARWLLMVGDRLDMGVMELTHDFVAQMLGVRRASVTETLGELERHGLIQTSRGRIRIIERDGLQETACECYGVIRGVVHRLLETGEGAYPLSPKMQSAGANATG
ncbi:MAG: Crp/Fnr family transcriptional regulator [Gemmatimonadaceae bacterium]